MTIAAIAIGSNSTRMLVHLEDGQEIRERAYTHLFMGLDEKGLLTEQAMADTADVISTLKRNANALGAEQVYLYATSAVRDAGNADAFSRLLFSESGLSLNIIPGETEAHLAFEAASSGRHCAVLDIGGGSTELTYGDLWNVSGAVSAQEGAARLKRECEIHTLDDAKKVRARVLQRLCAACRPLLGLPRPPLLVGIGGTCTTSAAILRSTPSHGNELDDTEVSKAFLESLLDRIIPLTLEERIRIPGLFASRAAIIPQGLCILLAAMDMTGFDRFSLSTRNNLDAIVGRMLRKTTN